MNLPGGTSFTSSDELSDARLGLGSGLGLGDEDVEGSLSVGEVEEAVLRMPALLLDMLFVFPPTMLEDDDEVTSVGFRLFSGLESDWGLGLGLD